MKSPSKSRKEQSTAAALLAVQKELASMRRRLDRADDRIKSLENKVIQLEKERDHFKDLYYKALANIRVKDKRIAILERKLEQAEKQLAWFRKQHFGQKTEAGAGSEPSPKPADDDEEQEPLVPKSTRKRGQQPGSKGHGRTNRSSILEADPEISSIADPVAIQRKKRITPGVSKIAARQTQPVNPWTFSMAETYQCLGAGVPEILNRR